MLDNLAILSQGIFWTVVVSGSAIIIGVILGLPISLMRQSRNRAVHFLGRSVIEIFRGIPPLVLLFIVFYGIGTDIIRLSPLAASIATLGIVTSVYMAEVYRAAFSAISEGQWEAGYVIGLTKRKTLIAIIIPQAIRVAVPTMATISIGVLKDSAIASTVGVQDITALAVITTNQTLQGIGIYSTAAVMYIAMSLPIALLSRWLHENLTRKVNR